MADLTMHIIEYIFSERSIALFVPYVLATVAAN